MPTLSISEQIGRLLAQAENTPHEEEKKTLWERAQKLGERHSIDLAVARSALAKSQAREEPTYRAVRLGVAGQRALSWYVELMIGIANANDLEITMATNSTRVTLYGMPSDIEVAEAIYNNVIVAMVQLGDEYLRRGDYRQETVLLDVKKRRDNPRAGEWGYYRNTRSGEVWVEAWAPKYEYYWVQELKPISGMTARQNFYRGFTNEIKRRLFNAKMNERNEILADLAKVEHVEDAQQTSTALVLKEKKDEVREFYESKTGKLGTYRGSKSPVYSSSATGAGKAAGANVSLGGHKALPGPRTQIGG